MLEYLQEIVAHFGITEKIRLGQECLSATWSSTESLWVLKFQDVKTKTEYTRYAHYLITAVGHSSVPKGTDDIPGIEKFRGDVVLSTSWKDLTYSNKNVMVIGNGASSNQIITWLLNDAKVKSLVHIFRQPQWLMKKDNPPTSKIKNW